MQRVCLAVARFWLVVVFAMVPLEVYCFLSCRDSLWLARTLERRQVVRGIRHARTARVLEVGAQWTGCKCSCQDIDIFLVFSK